MQDKGKEVPEEMKLGENELPSFNNELMPQMHFGENSLDRG